MKPGFQVIVDRMLEAGWMRGEIKCSLRRLIAANNVPKPSRANQLSSASLT